MEKHVQRMAWSQDDIRRPSELAIGIAGEHLVCAELLLSGYNAFMADQSCPYDVALDYNGKLIRIQVKTTLRERHIPQRAKHTPAYLFHVRRCGKGGRRSYNETDFDILALVALDIRKVAYLCLGEAKQTVHLNRGKFLALSCFERALSVEPVPKAVMPSLFPMEGNPCES